MNHLVLVITEQRDGALRQVSLEAVAAARLIAGDGGTVVALVAGSEAASHIAMLTAAGADRIAFAADPVPELSAHTERHLRAAAEAVRQIRPTAVVLGHTASGKDMAPRLAAQLGAGQLSDVIQIERSGDSVSFTRPIYAGKAFEKRSFSKLPWVVTIRPNNFKPAAPYENAADAPATDVTVETVTAPDVPLRTIVKQIAKRTSGKTDLSEAKIVVSGGRGVAGSDGFKPLEQLAEALGGAVGASRGACDAGYCDYSMQIGQTGKVVTPELYIACGISGAIQHLAGMSGSRIIVAINKDPEAPIFKVADYGIVGDLFEIVPLLAEEFKRLKSAAP
ncbi:electron transfer flavoprotein subunit alpha/FixB family protein [Paenibacillus ginsengarvi]|uniref:Electron transfer flavoprotein subunit alpha/FixB family protein n=1 Tax=Paenibacillus ginsengarvi TaxID=400777 RepID=A0A3B0CJK2_9BACL|nr:electron transfer flavoprotein subunit alpha/FixB family protein [Paenibacillus ginsengarvi]RKN84176.1 electron transfer flavoprotein subunit alpha/FixB family protein [Paenibacillus ginsengarvi]